MDACMFMSATERFMTPSDSMYPVIAAQCYPSLTLSEHVVTLPVQYGLREPSMWQKHAIAKPCLCCSQASLQDSGCTITHRVD
jgi:hypothetical protein